MRITRYITAALVTTVYAGCSTPPPPEVPAVEVPAPPTEGAASTPRRDDSTQPQELERCIAELEARTATAAQSDHDVVVREGERRQETLEAHADYEAMVTAQDRGDRAAAYERGRDGLATLNASISDNEGICREALVARLAEGVAATHVANGWALEAARNGEIGRFVARVSPSSLSLDVGKVILAAVVDAYIEGADTAAARDLLVAALGFQWRCPHYRRWGPWLRRHPGTATSEALDEVAQYLELCARREGRRRRSSGN